MGRRPLKMYYKAMINNYYKKYPQRVTTYGSTVNLIAKTSERYNMSNALKMSGVAAERLYVTI